MFPIIIIMLRQIIIEEAQEKVEKHKPYTHLLSLYAQISPERPYYYVNIFILHIQIIGKENVSLCDGI